MLNENVHPSRVTFSLHSSWPELCSAINLSKHFRTTMVVTLPKFQRDIPTLVQVLPPLLYVLFYVSNYWLPVEIIRADTILDLQAEVRVSTNSPCGRKNPYWTGRIQNLNLFSDFAWSNFIPGHCPVRLPHLRRLWRGRWKDSLGKMRRYTRMTLHRWHIDDQWLRLREPWKRSRKSSQTFSRLTKLINEIVTNHKI